MVVDDASAGTEARDRLATIVSTVCAGMSQRSGVIATSMIAGLSVAGSGCTFTMLPP